MAKGGSSAYDSGANGSALRPRSAELLQNRLVARDLQFVSDAVDRVVQDGAAVRAAARIVSARRRYIAGAGTSGAYAALMATQLTAGLAHVTLVDTFIRTVDIVSEVRDTDVLVTFAFAPYRRATIEFARLFHVAGSQVVAITDHGQSPLVDYADETIFVHPHHDDEGGESATAVAAVSSLVSSLTMASAKGARRRLSDRARISEQLGIYVDEN